MGTTRGSNARSDTRTVYRFCEPVRRLKGRKKRETGAGEAMREKKEEASVERGEPAELGERGKENVAVDVREEKKRWNSVVYPVIYNWKLGTASRPKAIRRFLSGESPSPFRRRSFDLRPESMLARRSLLPFSLQTDMHLPPPSPFLLLFSRIFVFFVRALETSSAIQLFRLHERSRIRAIRDFCWRHSVRTRWSTRS